MTRVATPKLGAYTVLAAVALTAALVLGRPALAILATPFLALVVAAYAFARDPAIEVAAELDRERAVEGDEVLLCVELRAAAPTARVDLLLLLDDGLEPVGEVPNPFAVRVSTNEPRRLEVPLRCIRWGAYRPGRLALRASDRFGLLTWEGFVDRADVLKVYPPAEALRALLPPRDTRVWSGEVVSREKGDGMEFADLRPFVSGDRIHRINWRASARRGELWVNEFHPERNADVILFLDSFAEIRRGGASTLDPAIRAAISLAERYLAAADRVGLVSFGGTLNWLLPAAGVVQLYRIVDSLLDTEVVMTHAWGDVDAIPARVLPPKALVVALSPLLDERSVGALLDLRARGFDLAVVEISPAAFVETRAEPVTDLALRLWTLRRNALRALYLSSGVPVIEWRDGDPLFTPIEELRVFRRRMRTARAG